MARQKTTKKKASGLSLLLDIVDITDAAVEMVTGKKMSSWIREFQEQAQVNQGDSAPQVSIGTADPYGILGLPANASLDQVKKRYRQLAGIYHPDRDGGYDEAMKRVNEAYQQILKQKGTGS